MKRILSFFLLGALLLSGCSASDTPAQIAATTLPVYEFTSRLCQDTGITVTRLVTESISCLHDYSLNVRQVKSTEAAEVIVISGAGLEEFLDDLLTDKVVIDASEGIELICSEDSHDHHEEADDHPEADDGHHHDRDPHIWLSPKKAQEMTLHIWEDLCRLYPDQEPVFTRNLQDLATEFAQLYDYGQAQLQPLSCRELITFHDGFAYLAECFDLTILEAVEEESGSEASARELIHLIEEVEHHHLPAIFTEKSSSVSAAGIISRETGCRSFSLDMAMAGDSYFDAMYHNIDTLKEALA